MKASDALRVAANLVSGDRADAHGDVRDSFTLIAAMWSARLGVTVTPAQVGWMMGDVKYARSVHGERRDDDFIDGAAYVALEGQVRDATRD